ncbi:MAG: substrate-binding domain-containing protein [Solirubrobacterales bacterium]
MLSRPFRVLIFVALVALCAAALAACGGGSSSSSSSESSGNEASSGSSETASSESSGGGADVAAAEKAVAEYTGKPSPFPVEEPLNEKLPADTKIVYMQCGSPICQLQWPMVEAAGKALGVETSRIKAGSQASEVANAFDTAVAEEPDAVLVPAIEPSLFRSQLEQLQENGTEVITSGVVDPQEYGIENGVFFRPSVEITGKLLAAKAVAEKGDEANIVYYEVPELAFIPVQKEAFEAEMENLCPECSVRYVDIPLSTVGNTAPNRMVSDLQQNPETNFAVFSTNEMAEGLPAAMKTAGIENVETWGFGSTPANLQDIKEGGLTGALEIDLPVDVWSYVDEAARAILGQELSKSEKEGIPPDPDFQFLEQKDITFNPEHGWTGYPEYEEKFAELWSGK